MSPRIDVVSVQQSLRDALPALKDEYGIESLAIFGSVVRGEADESSDVDVIVRFRGEPPGLFGFVRLERELSEAVGRSVDLVMESALKPRLRDRILAEAVAA